VPRWSTLVNKERKVNNMARLGKSDLEVFPVCLGGNVFSWTADEAASYELLDAFAAGGGNFIDTADSYVEWAPGNTGGESETIIGNWMKQRGVRDDVVIGTKVGDWSARLGLSAENIHAGADASLSRLQTDTIDLFYAHRDDPNTPLEETVGAFDALVKAGKIRYYGLSNYTGARVEELVATAKREGFALPVAIQPHYNVVEREPFESDLAPVVAREDIAVVPYYSLASGFLTGKYRRGSDAGSGQRSGSVAAYLNEDGFRVLDALEAVAERRGASVTAVSLAWLIAQPTVVAPVASASRKEQVPDLVAAASVQLTSEDVEQITAASGSKAAA
jgi:aryl-alcohol dehydrogenase-like predicted oxidoreductase